ncbi:MBL fold metallo-hydrolase [Myxococcota bacterium]|nr:MBL fold metallo-hydrolase [Myxococcota bacterium]
MATQRPRGPRAEPAIADLFAPREGAGGSLVADRAKTEAPSPATDAATTAPAEVPRADAPAPEPLEIPEAVDDDASAEDDAVDDRDAEGAAREAPEPEPELPPLVPARPVRTSPARFEPAGPRREFEYNGGIHLVDSILWCDADRRHDLCFLSHAHVDGIGKNRRILATDKTVKIMTRASGKIEALTSPFKRTFTIGPLELELHPAGHVLGSAQLLVTRDGRRLVYTSDVNTRPTTTAEKARPIPCDVLVIPATYGLPVFRFPPREEVYAQIKGFIDRCFEDRATPVLLANQIGTAQELMGVLGQAGYRLRVHRSIYDVAKIYGELGVSLPGSRRFAGSPARDEVVLFPPILKRHASIRKLRKSKTAIVSGQAVDPGFAFRQRVDEAFTLSDTVDHDELVKFIEETGAQEIYLSSGYVDELGAELRAKGLRVFPLVRPEQLALF